MRVIECDIAIVGAGLAGFAASIFAMKDGMNVAQTGNTGSLAYTTGYLDLIQDDKLNPWQALEDLRSNEPQHPLAAITDGGIKTALNTFAKEISNLGISYSTGRDENLVMLTPAGTTKQTFSVPATMQDVSEAMEKKAPCLFVDFKGLRGYSAAQIVANLGDKWPTARAATIPFPDAVPGEIYAEVMARSLEVEATVSLLAEEINKIKAEAEYIALPAILGLHNPQKVHKALVEKIGLPVFEVPTMPPAVPGIRLREMFEQVLPQKGLQLIPQQKVDKMEFFDDRVELYLSDAFGPITIKTKTALLASGRFLSGGLNAEITGINESLIGLPVAQPKERDNWYDPNYLGKDGHAIHKSGIEADSTFRPLGIDGKHHHPRLFAAGTILAHQDWIRSRSGAGIAIATAYTAVHSIKEFLAGQ